MFVPSVFDDLKEEVENFKNTIPEDQNCVLTVNGHSIHTVKKLSNELIAYCGNGKIIVQHVSQTNLSIASVPKAPGEPKRQIGFCP